VYLWDRSESHCIVATLLFLKRLRVHVQLHNLRRQLLCPCLQLGKFCDSLDLWLYISALLVVMFFQGDLPKRVCTLALVKDGLGSRLVACLCAGLDWAFFSWAFVVLLSCVIFKLGLSVPRLLAGANVLFPLCIRSCSECFVDCNVSLGISWRRAADVYHFTVYFWLRFCIYFLH